MKRDCIILGHLSKSDSVTSVLENEEGLYHPGTSVQNRSGDFSLRIILELRFKMYPEVSSPVKVVDCIILEPRFKMYPEVSAPVKVVDCIIPEPRFKMYLEISVPVNVVGLYHP